MTTTNRTGKKRGNGEGTITLRKDGRYEARVTLPGGRRKVLYGKTRAEVAGKLTATLRDVQQGLPVTTTRTTLSAFLARWIEDSVRPKVRAKTLHSYSQLVRVHINPALGKLTLEQVTPQRLQAFLNQKAAGGLSPRTVQYLHAVLRAALGRAVKWNLITRNPATLIDSPRVDRQETPVLAPAEALKLVAAFHGTRLETLVTLTLAMGLRQGEALGLRWSDLDFDAGTLTVRSQVQRIGREWQFTEPKSRRSRRTLALPSFVAASLREHRTRQLEERLLIGPAWQDWDLVFPSSVGTPWDGTNVTHEFQKHLAAAGLPRMRFHDLRHGAASLLLARGITLREIMEILGHSQISLTADLYTHVAPELKRKAADEMDRLFGTG